MVHSGIVGRSNTTPAVSWVVASIAASLLVGAAAMLITPTPASAKAEFAAQTGLPCGQCHKNPAGGGELKSFGEKFKANGFKVKK